MHDIIHFRSSSRIKKIGSGSRKMTHARSTDFDSLREYTMADDARDIAWKQSAKGIGTYLRSSLSEEAISLTLIADIDDGWDFSIDLSLENKHMFYDILEKQCHYTSSQTGNTYKTKKYTLMGIKQISEILIKEKVKNELILLLTGSLDPENYIGLELLAKHNDVIIIHLLHPYEIHPENYNSLLMESKTTKISRYKVELMKTLKKIKKELSNNDITHILASTEDNPAELLNFFFKHRYVQ